MSVVSTYLNVVSDRGTAGGVHVQHEYVMDSFQEDDIFGLLTKNK